MHEDLAELLGSLSRLNQSEFAALWRRAFGAPPRVPSRRDLLVRCLAYRLQERALGGLSAASRRRLGKLAARIEASPTSDVPEPQTIKPGTRLLREWRGETHIVTVIEGGFSYAGKSYRSLSEIARLITGTRWSGPLFFGLRRALGPRKRTDGD